MQFSTILAAILSCICLAAAGVVNVTRCEGFGTPIQTRISDCEGYCRFQPGQVYNAEQDFMPSGATPSLTLMVEICLQSGGGVCMQIIDAPLPNSSVQPGFLYTAKYSVVPNDVLSNRTVEMRAYISHTGTTRVDVCVYCDVDVL
ncbi:uncharacterized protein LOC110861279 [Folsomia candida]|uniref:Uncharacterized protein n=1 Tax=Folsomia candida TaxID=158441 RepID=A0A226D387_FOLCA|nr:uncharacterized protein LOC110861279 [Folsomia candida]OXA39334.1 hypothetical protein Fcan01_25899 [Folsomia candida]